MTLEEMVEWDNFRKEIIKELIETNHNLSVENERLRKYEKLVQFIANDYYELSHDKVKWQHNDWYKRCKNLVWEKNDD